MNSNSYRRFLPIKNWKSFWNTYKDEPVISRYLFEVIRSEYPCKPYLDIEWKVGKMKNAKTIDHSKFINTLQKDIIEIFKKRYDIVIKNKNILILNSHAESKVSFHVIINKYYNGKTVAYRTNLKSHPESAWDLWCALTEKNKKYIKVLDESVYTTDREFRTLYSNKTSDFRPFVPYDTTIMEDLKMMNTTQCLKYMITYFRSSEYHYITTPYIAQKYIVVNKKYCNDIDIPNLYSDNKINYLISLITPYHKFVTYTGRSTDGDGWRFSYEDKSELCYTGNRHDSNGFYVFEDLQKGIIYMKCMSSSCKGIKIIKKNKKPQAKLF
jgi:hypothetical protein